MGVKKMELSPKRRLMLHRLELAYKEWYLPRKAPVILDDRESVLEFAINHIGKNSDVTYLEFGVASGWSMNLMSSKLSSPQTRLVGFDSFEGLPEDWVTSDGRAGSFDMGGRIPPIDDGRVTFVKGWFQNTVGEFLENLRLTPGEKTLIHFDADLYSATLFLLSAFWWKITEYYFIFDEFHNEELIALYDFVSAYPVDIEFYATSTYKSIHEHPIQIFGKLINRKYERNY